MARALIGHTGFVGGNLRAQAEFTDFYNSSNIDSIAGRDFELVVCAGAPAAKWIANREPDRDRAALQRLIDPLGRVRARRFVLVSTVDVFPRPIEVDESSRIDRAECHAYGRHRLELEDFVRSRFQERLVARLPGLFGPGLKKNVVYDLLNDNELEKIHQDGSFQFYDLRHLWSDLERARAASLELVHFATEPVSVREVSEVAFGFRFENDLPPPAPRYDFRTLHAAAWGRAGPYLYDRRSVLEDLRSFVSAGSR